MHRSLERLWVPFLLLLTGGVLVAGVLRPNTSSFWADEAYTVLAVRAESWDDLLLVNLRNEETPPLYFAVARLWAGLWGDSREASLRLLSALCFSACIPLTALVGAHIWSRAVGLGGALLLATNPFALYYAQEARAYTLATLLGLLYALATIAYARRPGIRAWVAAVFSGAALCYTNYLGGFSVAGLVLAGAVSLLAVIRGHARAPGREGRMLRWAPPVGWAAAQVVTLLLLLPWLPAVRYQMVTATSMASPGEQDIASQLLAALLVLLAGFPNGGPLSLGLLGLATLLLALGLSWAVGQASVEQRIWLAGGLLLPIIGVLAIFWGDGQFTPRYFLLAQPWLLLLLAAGAVEAGRMRASLGLVGRGLLAAVAVGGLAYWLTMAPNPRRQGAWDVIAAQVAALAQPGDAVFFAPPWARAPFVVQYKGAPLQLYGAESFVGYYYDGRRPFVEGEFEGEAMRRHVAAGGRAWVVWDRIYGLRPGAVEGLAVEEWSYGSTGLLLVHPYGGVSPSDDWARQ